MSRRLNLFLTPNRLLHDRTLSYFGWGLIMAVTACLTLGGVGQAEDQTPIQQILHDLAEIKAEIAGIKKEVEGIKAQIVVPSPPTSKPVTPSVMPPAAVPPATMPPAKFPAPKEVTVKLGNDPSMGSADAPLALIEYIDFQCPFCARFHKQVLPLLNTAYIETGKLLYIHRDLPLMAIHAGAKEAANVAHCSGQANYWKIADLFLSDLTIVRERRSVEEVATLGIDQTGLKTCLDEKRHLSEIEKDMNEAVKLGISGTPGFVLGKIRADGEVVGKLIKGAKPFEYFQQEIESLLQKN